jgi:hypothetical protein
MNNLWFNEHDIETILRNAELLKDLRHPNAIFPSLSTPTNVINLSQHNGLILTAGNEATGFEHIHSRHDFFSMKPYWRIENGKEHLTNPSRFSFKSVPIFDYIEIADQLYNDSCRSDNECKNPQHFEMYRGLVNYVNEQHEFDLLLYRNTKIIHGLYPRKSVTERKKPSKFHFFRGNVDSSYDVAANVVQITIPYLNSTNKRVYAVDLLLHFTKRTRLAVVMCMMTTAKKKVGLR